jgi:hypothetical protein
MPIADLKGLHRAVGREPRIGLGHIAQHLLRRPERAKKHDQGERDAGAQHRLPDSADRSRVAQDLHGGPEQPDPLLVARPAVLVEQLVQAPGLPGGFKQCGHRLVAAVLLDVQHDHASGYARRVASWLAHVIHLVGRQAPELRSIPAKPRPSQPAI